MKRRDWIMAVGVVGAVALTAFTAGTACNSGNGDCPDKASVVAGGSCSDEHLQCAFDLTTPAVACDGTNTVISTSCTCTDGTWACPPAVECDGGTEPGEAGEEASTDDGGTEASTEDADASTDADGDD